MDIENNVCLEVDTSTEPKEGILRPVIIAPCQFHNPLQQWTFRNYTSHYEFLMSDKFVAREGTAQYKMLKLYNRYGRPQHSTPEGTGH